MIALWPLISQIAVIDAGHRARPHDAFQLVAARARDLAHRLFQRHLDLGKRRDWDPRRQLLVKHMVLTHVAMCQHVIAELLRVAQPGAVAEHQPCMGPHHRDMVGDAADARAPRR